MNFIQNEWLHAQYVAEAAACLGAGFNTLHERLKAGKTGMEVLDGMIAGTLPVPLACFKDRIFLVSAEPYSAVMQGRPGADCLNPSGTVEGAWMWKLADLAMGSAVLSVLPPDYGYATISFNSTLTRTMRQSVPLRASATLQDKRDYTLVWFKAQRQAVIHAEAVITDEKGNEYGRVEGAFRIFRTGLGLEFDDVR